MKQKPLDFVFAQLDVPVGEIEEVLPAIVLQPEADLDKRPPLGPLWLSNKPHARLQGSTVGLVRVTLDA